MRRPDDRSDTLATRPLETPVGGFDRRSPPNRRAKSWAFIAIAAALGAGGAIVWRARTTPAEVPSVPASLTSTASTAAATVSGASTTSASPIATGSNAPAITTAATAGTGTTGGAAPPTSNTPGTRPGAATSAQPDKGGDKPEKSGRAQVTLLGEPGTTVSIDGVSRGATPKTLTLEAGQHDVRFSFAPTAENLSEAFRLKAGEKVTVRAEFTGAKPTVRVQR